MFAWPLAGALDQLADIPLPLHEASGGSPAGSGAREAAERLGHQFQELIGIGAGMG